jgi:hypothetical protein
MWMSVSLWVLRLERERERERERELKVNTLKLLNKV